MKLFFDFERGPRLIQNYQTSLEWWIPEVPNDAVWGCVKSTTISFLITLFFTEGNVLIASKAGRVVSVASITHTAVSSLLKKLGGYGSLLTKKYILYVPHATSLIVLFLSYLFGRRTQMNFHRGWTVGATAVSYLLTQSHHNFGHTTPLFIAIGR